MAAVYAVCHRPSIHHSDPDHAFVIRKSNKLQHALPHLKRRAAVAAVAGTTPVFVNLLAVESEKIPLCHVAAYRVYTPLTLRLRRHNKFCSDAAGCAECQLTTGSLSPADRRCRLRVR